VFCRVLGLLRWEQGRLDEAAALLRQSARAFSEQCLPEEEGASLILVGLLSLERNETEMAIRLLQTGRAACDPEARPWLTVRAGLSLAQALAEIGHGTRAAGVLNETRWHYARAPEESEQLTIYWLEGKVCARLGRRDEAENLLAAVRLQFLAERRLAETLLSSLDLAVLLVEEGREAELPELLREIEAAFGADEAAIEVVKVARAFTAEIADRRTVSPDALAAAASTLRRVLRTRGVRVESLPFA
jgi:tetratricopeptide (TPR) repeat protein